MKTFNSGLKVADQATSSGAQGAQGFQGGSPVGLQGHQGAQGFQGGAQGAVGAQGFQGSTGTAGVTITDVSCSVYQTVAQSIPATAAFVALTFDTEAYDTSTMHSTSVNPSRITVPSSGKYLLMGSVDHNLATNHETTFRINGGSTDYGRSTTFNTFWGMGEPLISVCEVDLAAGDYVEMYDCNYGLVSDVLNGASFSVNKVGV